MKLEEKWARRVLAATEIADLRGELETDRSPDRVGGLTNALAKYKKPDGKRLKYGKRNAVQKKLKTPRAKWDPLEHALFLRRIAEACGLPYAFFTADFSRLPEIAPAEDKATLQDFLAEQAPREGTPPGVEEEDEDQSG